MAVIVAVIFIFITVFSISAGYKIFKENYQRSGQLSSRSYLILITLSINQIIVALLAFFFWLIYSASDMIAFVALDVFAIVFIVIFLLLFYNLFSRRVSKNSFTPTISSSINKKCSSPFCQKIIIFFGLVTTIPVIILYCMYWGALTQLAVMIGSETMIEINPYLSRDDKNVAYIDMSKKHNDISICGNIKNSNVAKMCKYSVETQALEEVYKEKISSTRKEDVINCVELKSEFSKNSIEPNVFDEVACEQLSLLQEAITKKDPLICDEILSPFGYPDVKLEDNSLHINAMEKHAACVVHFIDSPSWQQGCEKLYFGMGRYSHLAKCTDPYSKTVPKATPYFWFQ